jgi:uncharacterized membrane protein
MATMADSATETRNGPSEQRDAVRAKRDAKRTSRDAAPAGTHKDPYQNLGGVERGVSVALGTILGLAATQSKGPLGIMLGLAGGAMVARGVTGTAPVKRLLGTEPDERRLAKKEGWSSAAKAPRSVTINAGRDAVWDVLRNVAGWPSFMENITAARSSGTTLSFTAQGATGPVETRARITEDEPGQKFAWESIKGSAHPNRASFELREATGGRGTEIHALVAYAPTSGSFGRYAAKFTQKEPGIQTRRDLKRLKNLIEAGEVATNARNRAEKASNPPKS